MTDTLTIDVIDADGAKAGTTELPGSVFAVPTNVPLIHQVVIAQLAAARQGTHKAKTRAEVAGGGRKPPPCAVPSPIGHVWTASTSSPLW